MHKLCFERESKAGHGSASYDLLSCVSGKCARKLQMIKVSDVLFALAE